MSSRRRAASADFSGSTLYDKDKMDDLSADERKAFKAMLKRELEAPQ